MKKGARHNLTTLFFMLFGFVLIVWIIFYQIISNKITSDAEKRAELAAEWIMDDLGAELMNLERVSFTLVQNDSVRAFVTEHNAIAYYALSNQIMQLLENSSNNSDFVEHIMIYNDSGDVYRFAGKLSNTSCARIGYLTADVELPEHLVAVLDNTHYIGYAMAIHDDDGNRTGMLVMLIEEEKLLSLIHRVSPENELHVAIAARGEVIATWGEIRMNTTQPITRHVGLTPFEIFVAADKDYLSTSTRYFTMAAVITAVVFVALLIVFIRLLNRRFLSPMFQVMKNVEILDAEDEGLRLPLVQSEEFDNLVSRINEMLDRFDKQNKEVQAAELRVKNAEIQKQKALIFSLKKQINAHFTINTLNAIRILVEHGEAERAGGILSDLSALVRYAYDEDVWLPVWDELEIISGYVDIMNARYGNKAELVFDLDDRLMDYRIPRMLLQPIVENSLVYGFKDQRKDCVIEIQAALKGDDIVVSIRDNGRGMEGAVFPALKRRLDEDTEDADSSEVPTGGTEHIALVNIKRRLVSYFGCKAGFAIDNTLNEGVRVTITLPADMCRI